MVDRETGKGSLLAQNNSVLKVQKYILLRGTVEGGGETTKGGT